jgi:hypothetical protein
MKPPAGHTIPALASINAMPSYQPTSFHTTNQPKGAKVSRFRPTIRRQKQRTNKEHIKHTCDVVRCTRHLHTPLGWDPLTEPSDLGPLPLSPAVPRPRPTARPPEPNELELNDFSLIPFLRLDAPTSPGLPPNGNGVPVRS